MENSLINDLKNIIKEQQRIIMLLKERLTDLSNDFDKEINNKDSNNPYYIPCYRTEKWKW